MYNPNLCATCFLQVLGHNVTRNEIGPFTGMSFGRFEEYKEKTNEQLDKNKGMTRGG